MPSLLAEHTLTLVPAHRVITLRDADTDAGHDPDNALGRAYTDIAAGTGVELYVVCAHDLLPVTVHVRQWDGRPDPAPTAPDTGVVGPVTLEFPTGLAVLSSPTAEAVDFPLDTGPGNYTVAVEHRGRQAAQRIHHGDLTDEADQETASGSAGSTGDSVVEVYVIGLWRADVTRHRPSTRSGHPPRTRATSR